MYLRSRFLASSAIILAHNLLASGPAYAQSGQDAADSERNDAEIIVTAGRRSEALIDVPSNIAAISGDKLERAGVTDLGGMTRLVPGLVMRDEGPRVSGNQNSLIIRGLNAEGMNNQDDDPAKTQKAVSTYFGETPIFFPLKLVDIERVEVLRGPQGTLYGSGSVGGTIRILPKAPSTDGFYGELNAEGSLTDHADDASFELSGVLNFPLGDTVALRVSGGYDYYSGFIDALGLVQVEKDDRFDPGTLVLEDPGDFLGSPAAPAAPIKDVNDAETYFARAALKFEPSDNFDATLSYVFQKTSANDRSEHNPLFGTGEDYVQYKDSREPQDAEIHLGSLEMHVDVGFAQMTSATSYAETDVISISDSSGFLRTVIPQYYFGFPRVISPILRTQTTKDFTQELRLVSIADGPIEWLVGGYYNRSTLHFGLYQKVDGISDYVNQLYGVMPPLDFSDVLATGGTDKTSTELAGYGEISWNATDALSLTGGVRVFHTTLHGEGGIPLPFASRTLAWYYGAPLDDFLLGGIEPIDNSDDGAIFRINAAYDLSDQALVYATWAQGYRTGGSNPLPLQDAGGNDNTPYLTYAPDKLNSYELGVKGRFSRINYSATAYWIDWSDMQQSLIGNLGVPYIGNVPGARSRGFELGLDGQLTANLDFSLGYAYTDAEVTVPFFLDAAVPETLVPAGSPLPGSSEHTVTASANYWAPLSDSLELGLHADLSYRSESQSTFADIDILDMGVDVFPDDMFIRFPSSTVVNLSATLNWEDMAFTVFADNVTGEVGTNSGIPAEFYGEKSQAYGVLRPFTAGLRAKFKFGN